MDYEVKYVDPLSVLKVLFVIGVVIGLVVGLVGALFLALSGAVGPGSVFPVAPWFVLWSVVVAPVLHGLAMAILGALAIVVYNVVARLVGGIRIRV